MDSFTIVDGIVAAVVVLSALLAFSRGFTREAMAIAGWVVAAYLATFFSPAAVPLVKEIPVVGMAKETEEWRSLFSMVLIAGFGVVMLIISVIGSYGILATSRLEAHEQMLLQKLESMKVEKTLMQEEVLALKTSPEYIELIARKELGLVHSTELIYYLPPSAKDSSRTDF